MTYDQHDWNGDAGWGHHPEPQREVSGQTVSSQTLALIALLTVMVLSLLGVIAYLFLRPGGLTGDGHGPGVAASSSSFPAPSSPPPSSPPPDPETTAATSESPAPTPTSPTPTPTATFPPGADSSGWLDNRQSRCNADDPAVMIGRTLQSSFAVCINPGNGRYYYRGSSGGAGVEIDDPTVSGESASVTNNGVRYAIDSSEMRIYQDGSLISAQSMVEFWTQ